MRSDRYTELDWKTMEVNEGGGDVLQVLRACEDPGVLDILEPVQGFVGNPE